MRAQSSRTSRASQWSALGASDCSSAASTAPGRRAVRSTQVPISGSLKRRCRIASSSSRHAASSHASAPAATSSSAVGGLWPAGRTVIRRRHELGRCRRRRGRSVDRGRPHRRRSTPASGASGHAGPRGGPVRRGGPGRGSLRGRPASNAAPGRDRVDQPPLDGLLALDALGRVANTSARSRRTWRLSTTRVSPPVPGSTAEQRHLGQRDRRGPVVDEHDLVAGQRQLVAAAGRGAVDRGDPRLARVGGGVLDAVAGLVGELAEVHLVVVVERRRASGCWRRRRRPCRARR